MMKFSNNQIRSYAHLIAASLFFIIFICMFSILLYFNKIDLYLFLKLAGAFAIVSFTVFRIIKNITHTYIPIEYVCKNKKEINEFMLNFISRSTGTVTIVSHSLKWLCDEDAKIVLDKIIYMSKNGTKFEIITEDLDKKLQNKFDNNNNISMFKRTIQPRSRFTVINSTKHNSAELAIANGSIPCHKISTYNYIDSQHILDLALDTIEQVKKYHDK